MVRVDHVASHIMPLVCSNSNVTTIITVLVTVLLYTAFYESTKFLSNEQDGSGSNIFKPNSQDYFRTFLLGFFTPILFNFTIEKFIISYNFRNTKNTILMDYILDYPAKDLLLLFIIFCLAYPQLQDVELQIKVMEEPTWNIIPRQSYFFGISWSLSELLICIYSKFFQYQEAEFVESQSEDVIDAGSTERGGPTSDESVDEEAYLLRRNEISLSQCIDIRKQASPISKNVYNGYGDEQNDRRHGSNCFVVVSPEDNSLKITTEMPDIGHHRHHRTSPLSSTNLRMNMRTFSKIRNNSKKFWYRVFRYILVVTSSIMLSIGESLLMSIYFIYARNAGVNFGQIVTKIATRNFLFFIAVVVVPFTLLNLLVNVIIYFWQDLDELVNLGLANRPFRQRSESLVNYYNYYNPDVQPNGAFGPEVSAFPQSTSVSSFAANRYENTIEVENVGLRVLRKIIDLWKRVFVQDSAVIGCTFLWSLAVFSIGLVCVTF